MSSTVDIQDVIARSTSEVSLTDLTRKGFKQVKVLNHATIARLVAEAVDRTIADRQAEISVAERQRVIDESRKEFHSLAKERMEEQALLEQLRADNAVLAEQARANEETVRRLQGELEALRRERSESEKIIAKYEGQLAARAEDLERILGRESGEEDDGLARELQERLRSLEERSGSEEEIRATLDSIRQSLATIARGGYSARRGEDVDAATLVKFAEKGSEDASVESNFSQVQVKQARSSGVKGSLARLRELKEGAEDDSK